MTVGHPFSTRKGRRLRQAKLRAVDHLCERCRHQGRLAEAVEVHHRVPLHQGGDPYPPLNGLEALCSDHHYERSHGKRRSGGGTDSKSGLPTDPSHWWNAK